jgi:hypothetical protein
LEGRIPQLPLDKENKLKEGSWKAWEIFFNFYLVFFLEEEENKCVREELIFMCEKMLFMEQMCANKRTWRENVCNK